MLMLISPAAVGQSAPGTAAGGSSAFREIEVGLYLASLYDVNPETSSFLAEFYVWTDQRATDFDPLETMVFPGSKGQELVFKSVREVNGVQWSLRRYRATFFHDWDLTFFPFDKHELKIQLRQGAHQDMDLRFKPDLQYSGMDRHFTAPGWRTSQFSLRMEDVTYNTTFGNPAGTEPEKFSWITAALVLASLIAWSSIVTGNHHPSDVAVSIVLALAIAWFTWRWMQRYGPLGWLWLRRKLKPKSA